MTTTAQRVRLNNLQWHASDLAELPFLVVSVLNKQYQRAHTSKGEASHYIGPEIL